jgi:hypothetical protein
LHLSKGLRGAPFSCWLESAAGWHRRRAAIELALSILRGSAAPALPFIHVLAMVN